MYIHTITTITFRATSHFNSWILWRNYRISVDTEDSIF